MFRGERTTAALIEFVMRPVVYLLEADVAVRGEGCIAALQARGVLEAPPEEAGNTQRAQAVVDAAHRYGPAGCAVPLGELPACCVCSQRCA